MIRSLRIALVCVAPLGFASPLLAQRGIRLNGPLAHGVVGVVGTDQFGRLTISPDSAWIVFVANGQADGGAELYSSPAAGGPARKISAPMAGSEWVTSYVITADSARVVYVEYRGVPPYPSRLYSVPIDGSSPSIELAQLPEIDPFFVVDQAASTVLFRSGSARFTVPIDGSAAPILLNDSSFGPAAEPPYFELTPDGTRAVFKAASSGAGVELFSQPSDGSSPAVRLSGVIATAGSGVKSFRLDASGTQVVYIADQDTTGVHEIYAAPVDGSAAAVRLNGPLVSGGDVGGFYLRDFAIDPSGMRVVYVADQSTDDTFELYSSNLVSAASNVKLNGALGSGGDVVSFRIAPSGTRVLYNAIQIAEGDWGLFSAPIDGSAAATALYAPAGESVGTGFFASPDESLVVFVSGTSPHTDTTLQRVPFLGGAAVRLTPLTVDPTLNSALVPDLSRLVFRGNPPGISSGRELLYSVPMDGTQTLTQLSPGMGLTEVDQFVLAPDGSFAIYRADEVENHRKELFSVPPDGSAPSARVNMPLAQTPLPAGDVTDFQITADGAHAVYQANEDDAAVFELYSVATNGLQPPLKLNDPVVPGGGVFFDYRITADARVLYRAHQDRPHAEIYSVPVDRSTAPMKLTGPMIATGDVSSPFFLTPDETLLLYRADASVDNAFELFSAPTDGSALPVRLHAALGATRDVSDWMPSADAERAVFSGDLDADEMVELYAAPIDGSSSAVKLNGPMQVHGDVLVGLHVGAGRVVYGADQDTDEIIEIYSAPVDGSGPAVKLNGPLAVNRDVDGAAISDDGSTVLYLADQVTNGVMELFGVPTDGSSVAVRLNGTLPTGGDVTEASIAPAGDWAVYLADQDADEHFELFGAPTDGSTAAVRLSPTVPSDVSAEFEITPDGARVLFVQLVSGRTNLYSAPIDGSAPALRLNPAMAFGRRVTEFHVDATGRVLYVADHGQSQRLELYGVPADGSAQARRVSKTFGVTAGIAPLGFNPSYAYTPTGTKVLYRADQATDTVFELFATFLDGDKTLQTSSPGSSVEVETALSLSAAPPRSAPLVPGARLTSFQVASALDGQDVVPTVVPTQEEFAPLGMHGALQGGIGPRSYERPLHARRPAFATPGAR